MPSDQKYHRRQLKSPNIYNPPNPINSQTTITITNQHLDHNWRISDWLSHWNYRMRRCQDNFISWWGKISSLGKHWSSHYNRSLNSKTKRKITITTTTTTTTLTQQNRNTWTISRNPSITKRDTKKLYWTSWMIPNESKPKWLNPLPKLITIVMHTYINN